MRKPEGKSKRGGWELKPLIDNPYYNNKFTDWQNYTDAQRLELVELTIKEIQDEANEFMKELLCAGELYELLEQFIKDRAASCIVCGST